MTKNNALTISNQFNSLLSGSAITTDNKIESAFKNLFSAMIVRRLQDSGTDDNTIMEISQMIKEYFY